MTTPAAHAPPLTWDEVADTARRLGGTAYLATVSSDGRPHVTPVGVGLDVTAGRAWTATSRRSVKGRNLAATGEVALHWPEAPDAPLLFARGTARLVDDPDETRTRWDDGVLPYDPTTFWTGWDDPDLVFVEVAVERVVATAWGYPTRRWTAGD